LLLAVGVGNLDFLIAALFQYRRQVAGHHGPERHRAGDRFQGIEEAGKLASAWLICMNRQDVSLAVPRLCQAANAKLRMKLLEAAGLRELGVLQDAERIARRADSSNVIRVIALLTLMYGHLVQAVLDRETIFG